MKATLGFLLSLLFLMTSSLPLQAAYIWSVVPQFSGIAVHRDWTPLLNHLSKVTGQEFKLKIMDSIPNFESAFVKGGPDFAYMNPYHAVVAQRTQGYIPIVRNGSRLLEGILAVRKDSPINSVKELNGKKIAFPSPNAFAAALFMRALLTEKEKIEFTPVYTGTHSNAYRFVLVGKASGNGAVRRTLKKERDEVKQALKIIYTTPKSPSHPVVVHPRVPSDVREAVQKEIISLNNTAEGRKLLSPILLSDVIAADYARDYKPLELLNLDKYWVQNN